ncbi:MAG TPA: Gfo/Idh/MocA family oxidoreductase [Bryobacteraceae bacterium]|nr:Gfo/Idh/MocA family oxidoreductase [Bryobacteraceae bacterium]
MPDVVRIGIIGCGKVSCERHHPALRRMPEFRVVAVCDRDPERLAVTAALYRAERALADYRELVQMPGIDAVAVLTETASHAEAGVSALEAGKHLFMEKPLALTLDEADQLVDARRRAGRVAQVCFNLRWHRLIRKAKAMIEAGLLGRVKAIRSVYTHDRTGADAPEWHKKLGSGGGVSFNEGVHHYDLWRYLLGREVQRIGSLSTGSDVYEDETCVTSATLDGGVLASAVMSFLTGPNSEVEVFGEKGRLLISLYRFDGLQFYSYKTYPGAHMDRLKRGIRALAALPGLVADTRNGGGFQATFVGAWSAFGQSIRSGQPPECTLDDGRKALEIALAAAESVACGRPIDIRTTARGGGRLDE